MEKSSGTSVTLKMLDLTKQELSSKVDLMMQKMDENQARWRVDIEEQN